MARAHGARAQMALAFETTYGTPPASGYTRMPFASTTLGAEQPLLNSELLGYGRDPLAPIKDALTADGDVVVPIDAEAFGFWLKGAFGAPTTTGTGARALHHEFRSGGWVLPSMAIEVAMPEVPRFAMYSGCVLDQLWQMQRAGLLTATARLVAQGEALAATTGAGTPAALDLQRFGHFNGTVTRNGAALGNLVSAEITYANNLDRIETIRADGRIDGADPGMAALTGRIEVRFADQVLANQAIAGDPCEIELGWSLPSGESLTFTIHAVYLPRPRIEVPGRRACRPPSTGRRRRSRLGRMCTVTLVNEREDVLMITLDLTNAPRWLDLLPGVRLKLRPLTTALMVSRAPIRPSRPCPEATTEELALAMAKAVARRAVLDWEGVGDAEGNPVGVSPEGIDALLEIWPPSRPSRRPMSPRACCWNRKKTPPRPRRVVLRRGRALLRGLLACPDCPARLNRR
jgi:hypothetical protein